MPLNLEKNKLLGKQIYYYTTGSIIIIIGIFFIFARILKIKYLYSLDEIGRYMYGAICLLYGFFRLFRGFNIK